MVEGTSQSRRWPQYRPPAQSLVWRPGWSKVRVNPGDGRSIGPQPNLWSGGLGGQRYESIQEMPAVSAPSPIFGLAAWVVEGRSQSRRCPQYRPPAQSLVWRPGWSKVGVNPGDARSIGPQPNLWSGGLGGRR